MARKPKGEEALTERVAFRLTAADYAAYKQKVSASGLSPSEFFRDCVLTNRTEIIARPVMDDERRQALFLLSKASNNINQIAHRANSDHAAGIIDGRTYRNVLDSLNNLSGYLKAMSDAD
ncbi:MULTISPECIES: plasmid mobilization protein [Burkholderiaceae]|uniref:plasmid mobilization protein n=1 Tax=Burkholderiaceae TaxID=119060 RepID=UPI0015FC78FD|nr:MULTISPECIES: plasmid mobilization relaxosome protein MobC [Burkholderiaceae]MBA9902277.1 plasmid mobilization relaxosome protein MobC [Burkholderia cepacia]MBA9949157.1 plasmid mobilization relaxosome protein MobC [Burkholderia cepacia]MBA9979456.1 plasmid mobilization relaxosome protein MobC [Burkholderia cepacia]MBA9998295.1 plasmid mobilization relaxosome protein MobC [Burkholderia cepacia]MBB0006245.1 plasmid mobilization relaxosome protein MobC [Burkholderia cepacia]